MKMPLPPVESAPIPGVHPTSEIPRIRLGWASIPPILCAAHCALTPVLAVTAAPWLAAGESMEWVLLGGTALIAGGALRLGWPRHRSRLVLLLVGLALVSWGVSLAGGFEPLNEEAATALSALLLAGALLWNARLQCRKPNCGPTCTHGVR